jgi:nucleoid-associated protein YgaU
MIITESSSNPTDRVNRANSQNVQLTGTTGVTVLHFWQLRRAQLIVMGAGMKRYVAGTLAALAAPAAGVMFAVSPATAAASTAPAASPAALRCHASMSDSRPKDYTTIYVNVGTARYAGVTTVAYYKTVNREHVGKANAGGTAKIGYYISGATPGYRVTVSVTVTSGWSRGTCSTSFIPHR